MMNKYYSMRSDNVAIDRSESGIVIIVDEMIYILGDIETLIWDKLEQKLSIDKIIEYLASEYSGQSRKTIENDVESFINSLLKSNLIY